MSLRARKEKLNNLLNSKEIKNVLSENVLAVNKALGQNFLVSKSKRDKIVELCDIKTCETILEIGPGLGALTEAIQPVCKKLFAVEKDRGFAGIIKDAFKNKDNVEIINADILKYSIPAVPGGVKVIGNLPYYITSPVIFYLIENKDKINSIFVTVQKEVAQRIVALPGSRDYGISGLMVSYHCKADMICKIGKKDFFPQPSVDSSLLRLVLREKPPVEAGSRQYLFKLIKAGFNQRRKTLFNALSNSKILNLDKNTLTGAFDSLGLDMRIRAEQLGLKEFASLSDMLMRYSQ